MTEPNTSRLKRPLHDMPAFVEQALREHGMTEAYRSRPAYQRNDYIGWITRARLEATKAKRLRQMLDELKGGTLYMNMPYHPKHHAALQ